MRLEHVEDYCHHDLLVAGECEPCACDHICHAWGEPVLTGHRTRGGFPAATRAVAEGFFLRNARRQWESSMLELQLAP